MFVIPKFYHFSLTLDALIYVKFIFSIFRNDFNLLFKININDCQKSFLL